MRQQFNPEDFNVWLDYYTDQASQVGYGIVGFKGTPYQRGAGLGSFFRSLFRMAIPIIKSVGSKVGKQALASGAHIAADVLHGRPIAQSFEEHGKEGASNLLKQAGEMLQQRGRGLGVRPKSIKGTDQDVFSTTTKRKRTKK